MPRGRKTITPLTMDGCVPLVNQLKNNDYLYSVSFIDEILKMKEMLEYLVARGVISEETKHLGRLKLIRKVNRHVSEYSKTIEKWSSNDRSGDAKRGR